ncbi:Pol [Symbiodinium sp. CCMP2592]|nr:Pol [Symbiodinium sp. CCMP2592]
MGWAQKLAPQHRHRFRGGVLGREMMPAVLEKVESAEDEVEKVSIAAAPLQMEGNDDLRHVMLQVLAIVG